MSYWFVSKNFFFIIIIILLAEITVCAQTVSFVEYTGEKEFLIHTEKEELMELRFHIKDNYHIQSNQLNNEHLIPTVLNLTGPDNFVAGDALFPSSSKFLISGIDEPLDVFSNQLTVYIPVKITNFKTEDNHNLVINGSLYYQACDSLKCFYPRNLDFTLIIKIIE
jgi:hypothetical protein